jgi:hypothetical protein
MTEDGFGLDDIIDFISEILPPGIGGLPEPGLDGGPGHALEDPDALMAEQAQRIPELQEPPPAEEQEAVVADQGEQQQMMETLNELSSMRHQTAMNTINNIR